MTERQSIHHHHKIKAEWTKSATNEIYGKTNEDDCKIKIIEQIVILPKDKKGKTTRKKINKKSESSKCGICEKKIYENIEAHEKTHENSFFNCPEENCNKKFRRKSSLRKHSYFHLQKFKYTCEDCNEAFVDKVKFEIHKASKHQRVERTFRCQLCDKTFSSSDYLKRHQVTHNDVYKYSCKTCNQKFKWLTSLQAHKQIHTQNKTMVHCKECQKCFFSQRTLDRHMKIHENKRYQCGICKSITSNRKDNIFRHIRHIHTDIPRKDISVHVYIVNPPSLNFEQPTEECNDDDDDDNVLIIDESIQNETSENPPNPINNRVNVIQTVGNPNKNVSAVEPVHEIQLPPKKKVTAKYNPIAQYRAILGLTDPPQDHNESKGSEEVFPVHWRKRTSQNFLFKR